MHFTELAIISLCTNLTMAFQKYICTFICLYFCYKFDVVFADEYCDKSKCKGPVQYYEDLGCTPIYGSDNPCCPIKYNCDHLKGRSPDKCYYKAHEYKVNESLRPEDANPCQKNCHCAKLGAVAQFNCAVVDCPLQQTKPGCYRKQSHTQCCGGEEVCPKPGLKLAECVSDGKTYFDGQRFTPSSDPTQSCICSAGYQGKNVAPFCKSTKTSACGSELYQARAAYDKCSPVFYSNQNPATDCHTFTRCQVDKDEILKEKVDQGPHVLNPDATCSFGKLTLKLGEQLNQATGYDSVCVKCVCDVPPLLTCQRLPDDVCDVTIHPKFDNFKK